MAAGAVRQGCQEWVPWVSARLQHWVHFPGSDPVAALMLLCAPEMQSLRGNLAHFGSETLQPPWKYADGVCCASSKHDCGCWAPFNTGHLSRGKQYAVSFWACWCFIYQRQSATVYSSLLWSKGGKGSVGCLRVGPSLCGDAKRIVGFEESEMLCFIFVSMCPNRAEKCWLTQWEAVSSAGWRWAIFHRGFSAFWTVTFWQQATRSILNSPAEAWDDTQDFRYFY